MRFLTVQFLQQHPVTARLQISFVLGSNSENAKHNILPTSLLQQNVSMVKFLLEWLMNFQ